MSLLNFPNEILLHILENITEGGDVYALARTNRLLSALLAPRLFELAFSKEYCVIALYIAAANRNEERIRLLLDKGSPMLTRDYGSPKQTKLYNLTEHDKEIAVKRLLEKGPKTIILSPNGRSAIHLAVMSRNIALVKLLLSKGVDASITGPDGCSPVSIAAKNEDAAILRLFSENNVNTLGCSFEWRLR